ncbi:MAG: hypothetical protein H6Q68_3159 [Firmicutes bacterium]|nr:hypothetical protein [Bacillota bacterium]
MDEILDLRGLSCPIPLIKTRDALGKVDNLTLVVDEPTARENILKFAKSQKYRTECTSTGCDYQISIFKK